MLFEDVVCNGTTVMRPVTSGSYFNKGWVQMMKKVLCLLAFSLALAAFWGCRSNRAELPPPTVAVPVSHIKIRVVDVSNDTRELYDVDVIGMMWSSLEDSLKKRGMLWTPDVSEVPLTLEAHVLKYQEGNIWLRPILPPWGKTVLNAKCEVKDQGRVVATAESKSAITFGHETFTIGAWRKIFAGVAEDLVSQATRGL